MKAVIIKLVPVCMLVFFTLTACSQSKESNSSTTENLNTTTAEIMSDTTNWNKLSPEEERVIVNKGTEMSWVGEFVDHHQNGTYTCARCNAPLFESETKFDSRSGWPAFDDCIEGALKENVDADGQRTEIVCASCEGHLGHVFRGEDFTDKSTRHCVNSISMNFVEEK